jgi:hypothetical protein
MADENFSFCRRRIRSANKAGSISAKCGSRAALASSIEPGSSRSSNSNLTSVTCWHNPQPSIVDHSQVGSVTPLPEQEIDMAGDITFVKCPRGDSFPVRKTASPSAGHQQIICPRCGHDFDVTMDETVERLSPEPNLAMAKMRTA